MSYESMFNPEIYNRDTYQHHIPDELQPGACNTCKNTPIRDNGRLIYRPEGDIYMDEKVRLTGFRYAYDFNDTDVREKCMKDKHDILPVLDMKGYQKNYPTVHNVYDNDTFQSINDDDDTYIKGIPTQTLDITPVIGHYRHALYPEIPGVNQKNVHGEKEYFAPNLLDMHEFTSGGRIDSDFRSRGTEEITFEQPKFEDVKTKKSEPSHIFQEFNAWDRIEIGDIGMLREKKEIDVSSPNLPRVAPDREIVKSSDEYGYGQKYRIPYIGDFYKTVANTKLSEMPKDDIPNFPRDENRTVKSDINEFEFDNSNRNGQSTLPKYNHVLDVKPETKFERDNRKPSENGYYVDDYDSWNRQDGLKTPTFNWKRDEVKVPEYQKDDNREVVYKNNNMEFDPNERIELDHNFFPKMRYVFDKEGGIDLHKLVDDTPKVETPKSSKLNEKFQNYVNEIVPQQESFGLLDITNFSEPFGRREYNEKQFIDTYLEALRARAISVCFYLKSHPAYRKYRENWEFLHQNLNKTHLLFEKLNESDGDIAYVIDKGEQIKFRIRDEKRFIPINIYQYVLYHEMSHMSTRELQHTPKFFELLSIIVVAGFELGYIDLRRVQSKFFLTNGKPILCKASLKDEIVKGCKHLTDANPNLRQYYSDLKSFASKF